MQQQSNKLLGMAAENKPSFNNSRGKKRKFLPHCKPVKKGLYPLSPGVQGFFITCDGGRERQASNEALNLLESFYDELDECSDSASKCRRTLPTIPVNKITKFKDSDSSSDEGSFAEDEDAEKQKEVLSSSKENKNDKEEIDSKKVENYCAETYAHNSFNTPSKKQCIEKDTSACKTTDVVSKPIDERIDDELSELSDRKKRRFISLDSGCNGCIFIQMRVMHGCPSPTVLVQHMMSSAALTKKHMSRFILRVIPVEVTCYASEEEISKSIRPLIEQFFPADSAASLKFAVLYEARSNTGIERMAIIDCVAKSVPSPHKVNLTNPDKTIVVQIAKTICMIGVVERYKELAKFNLRQLTSPLQ